MKKCVSISKTPFVDQKERGGFMCRDREKEWQNCVRNFYKAFSLSDNVQVSVIDAEKGMTTFCKDWEDLRNEYAKTSLSKIGGGMYAEPIPETLEEFKAKAAPAYAMNLHYEGRISLFKKRDNDMEAIFDDYDEYHEFFQKIYEN